MPNMMDSGLGILPSTISALQGGKGTRFAFRALRIELADHAVEYEMIVDYKTNHIYFKNSDGVLVSKTLELEKMLQRFLGENIDPDRMGNNITIQVEGIVGNTIEKALKELLDKIIKEREESPFKANVRVATTDNISLNGLQTIDNIILQEGDRVLVKNQILPTDNGIYIVKADAWEKPTDYNEATDTKYGMVTYVVEGDRNGGYMFAMYPKNGNTTIEQITRDKFTTGIGLTYNPSTRELKMSEDLIESSGNYIKRDSTGRVVEIEDLNVINTILPTDSHENYKKCQMIFDKYNASLNALKFSDIAGLDVEGKGQTDLTILRNGPRHLLPLTSSHVVFINNNGLKMNEVYNNTAIFEGDGVSDKLLAIYAKNTSLTNKSFMFTLNGITIDNEPFNLDILISSSGSSTKAQITETTRTERSTVGVLYNNTLCIDIRNLKKFKVYNKWYHKSIYDEFVIKNNEYQINKYEDVRTNTTILPNHNLFDTLAETLFSGTTYPLINQTVKLSFASDEQVRNIIEDLPTGEGNIIDLKRLSVFLKKMNSDLKPKLDMVKDANYTDKGLVKLSNNIEDGNLPQIQDTVVPSMKVIYGINRVLENLNTNSLKGSYINNTEYTLKARNDSNIPIVLKGLKDGLTRDSAITKGAFDDYKSSTNSILNGINQSLLPENIKNSIGLNNYTLNTDYNNGTNINVSNWITKLGLDDIVTGDGPANGDILSGNSKPVNGGKIYNYINNITGGVVSSSETKMVSGAKVYERISIERQKIPANRIGIQTTKNIDSDTLVFADSLLAIRAESYSGSVPEYTATDAPSFTLTDGDYIIQNSRDIIFQSPFGFEVIITVR